MEVVTRPTDDEYSQVSLVPPFRLHQSYSLARTNRSKKSEDNVPDYEGPATMSGSKGEAILLCLDRQSNHDLRAFLFAYARAALGWRSCVSIGLISAPKTMHALP